jgi:hypothetical protein
MSVSGISSSSLSAAYSPPPVQQQQAKAPVKTPSADTVTISKQAQHLATDGDTAAVETQESGSEKAGEALKGRA